MPSVVLSGGKEELQSLLVNDQMDLSDKQSLTKAQQYDSTDTTTVASGMERKVRRGNYNNVPIDEHERDVEDPSTLSEERTNGTRSVSTRLTTWTRTNKYVCLGIAVAVILFISSASLVNEQSSNNNSNTKTHLNTTDTTVSLVPIENISTSKHNGSDTTEGLWKHKPPSSPIDSSTSSSSSDTSTKNNPTVSSMDDNGAQILNPVSSYDTISNDKDTMASILPGGTNLGYIQYPHVYNNTIVFCSEGNLYLTEMNEVSSALHSMKLTHVIGNVLTPKINPKYPHLIAYTATYTGRREVYLIDLRPHHRSQPSIRLTYLDSVRGALHIIGWEQEGTVLVIGAYSMDVSLDDYRLYTIQLQYPDSTTLDSNNVTRRNSYQFMSSTVSVSKILPIPLSQAIDSVVAKSTGEPTCRYFTRFSQSSNTIRYVGGTAESLWVYCDDEPVAIPLTADYYGTSKSPYIYTWNNGDSSVKFLLFLSDRSLGNEDQWVPTTMNLWAMILPTYKELYPDEPNPSYSYSSKMKPFVLTSISCQFNGLHIREFTVDDVTGNAVLRIGADLFFMTRSNIESKLSYFTQTGGDPQSSITFTKPKHLPVVIYSDFHNLHERVISLSNPRDVETVDIFTTDAETAATLMTARGQLFVNPIRPDISKAIPYSGGGMNMPNRRYRVGPGTMTGGIVRIFGAWSIPIPQKDREIISPKGLVLATDPTSPTAEMAFYIVNLTAGSPVTFTQIDGMPRPFIGGHSKGGSVPHGGLGSIYTDSVALSPCGRRAAWTDTDGRISVMSLSLVKNSVAKDEDLVILPQQNENNEPMIGIETRLTWSPAGRYLAIEHQARNQFRIISIADLGDPSTGFVNISRIAQATVDRFNSFSVYWGRSAVDFQVDSIKKNLFNMGDDLPPVATTLYFISDRDVILDGGSSPWGSRAPSPSIADLNMVYALPLVSKDDEMNVDPIEELYGGNYVGEGGSELLINHLQSWEEALFHSNRNQKRGQARVKQSSEANDGDADDDSHSNYGHSTDDQGVELKGNASTPVQEAKYAKDIPISLGPTDLSFARRAYAISQIPMSRYLFLFQLQDNPSLIVAEIDRLLNIPLISLLEFSPFPENVVTKIPIISPVIFVQDIGISTDRNYLHVTYSGRTKVFQNTVTGVVEDFVKDLETFSKNIVDTDSWAVRVWPQLEYRQMYSDAWRMLRDYYYDPKMTGINWLEIHSRYVDLVNRCARREELDDVMKQMSSELSALHVFVYGGEYPDPLRGYEFIRSQDDVASLAASLERSSECFGYIVNNIATLDPDFNPVDGASVYSPLTDRTLEMSGQRGLAVGDVIVGINGESVMSVPDIFMLLRGQAGRTVRLDVIRLKSKSTFDLSSKSNKIIAASNNNTTNNNNINNTCLNKPSEPVLVVPLSSEAASNVRYLSWEWKTRQQAKSLAAKAGFTVGYIHLRSMVGAEGEDSFIRGFYPDFDKEGMIIDVRHNVGGNIDSWLLTALQKKAWMYWQDRARNITTGGMGWDEQFAFRGHVVVLINEKTSSDGEGFARGISELHLGRLVGTRTWGGGIWLSSDNKLVDGGLVTAPEVGTYNEKFGWGLGIEQVGVIPDYIVDNNPRETFDGRDEQLEEAINVLRTWLLEEPIAYPRSPNQHPDMTINKNVEGCAA